eukprot:304930_1
MERFTKSVRIHSKRRFCSTDGLLIQIPKLFSLTICIIKCCIPYGSLCVNLNRHPFCRRDANDPRIATQFGEFLITQAPCAQDLMNKYMKQRNKWPANHPFFTMTLNQNQSTQKQ